MINLYGEVFLFGNVPSQAGHGPAFNPPPQVRKKPSAPDSANDRHDPAKHRVTFRIYPQALLRSQAQYVEITGIGDSEALLDEIIDARSEAVNESLKAGKNFQLRGSHIRVASEHGVSGWGVLFVPSDGSATVPVTDRLVDNQANYVAGIVPALNPPKPGAWKCGHTTAAQGVCSKKPENYNPEQRPRGVLS